MACKRCSYQLKTAIVSLSGTPIQVNYLKNQMKVLKPTCPLGEPDFLPLVFENQLCRQVQLEVSYSDLHNSLTMYLINFIPNF